MVYLLIGYVLFVSRGSFIVSTVVEMVAPRRCHTGMSLDANGEPRRAKEFGLAAGFLPRLLK